MAHIGDCCDLATPGLQAVKEQHIKELEKLKRSMNEREAAGENAWESRASERPSDTHLLTSSALPQVLCS